MEFFSWLLIISSVLFGLHTIIETVYTESDDGRFIEVKSNCLNDSKELSSTQHSNDCKYGDNIIKNNLKNRRAMVRKNVSQVFETIKKTLQDAVITSSSVFGIFPLIWRYLFFNMFEMNNRKIMADDTSEINIDHQFGTEVTMVTHRNLNMFFLIILFLSMARAKHNCLSPSLLTKKIYLADMTSLQLSFFNKAKFEDLCFSLVKKSNLKSSFNYDWMYPPFETPKAHLNSITCNSLTLIESQRLASYRSLPARYFPDGMSVILLASAGFIYSGRQDVAHCDYCGNEVSMHSFMFGDSMLDPKNPTFHRTRCSSLKKDAEDDRNKGTALDDTSISNNEKETIQSSKDSASLQTSTDDTILSQCFGHTPEAGSKEPLTKSYPAANVQLDQGQISIKESDTKDESVEDISTPLHTGAVNSPELKQQGAQSDDGYVSDDPNFVDSRHFNLEHACCENSKHSINNNSRQPIRSFECAKNPGHFAYFPMSSLTLEQLPGKLRHKDFLTFLQLFSMLTVRVVVNVTSSIRHWTDLAVKESGKGCRVGTGWVSFEDFGRSAKETFPISSVHGKWKTVKSYMKTLVKKSEGRIYIETNRHIVIDNHEAENTTVEFLYDDPSRRGVKVVKCVAVHLSGQTGDNRAILECKTGDNEFLQRLQEIRQKLKEMVEVLPRKIKSLMCKKLFIIHHPHGREKHLSYGDSVMTKYSLVKASGGKDQMVKVNNQTSEGALRKVLLYAADTCPGTSGAPVLTFQKGLVDVNGLPTYFLNVWIHNGEEKNNMLGGAAMKELTPEDHQLFLSRSQQSATNEAEGDNEEEEASLGQERVSAPSFTVIAPPAYLQYASFEERVQSFIISLVTLIYSPTFFARAGFFYAGYEDCVRCFQCGLGLRSWKAGDNVYEQHLKHRPDCQYLKTQLKSGIPTPNDQWLSENVQSNGSQATKVPSDSCGIYARQSETIYNVRPMESSPKECLTLDNGESTHSENLDATKIDEASNHQQQDRKLAMNLLLSENEMLKSNLLCKVCHKEPVRDLFLPCGELYACSDCSKMLTHCPSCKHQIMATVTTYLT